MRILYVLTDEISSVLVRGQLGFLVSEGFDVTVACRLDDPAVPKSGAWDEGVRVEHLPFVREPSPLADVRALWATWRLIGRVHPHAVLASTPKAGLLGTMAARLRRVPVRVYHVRGFRFETATGRAGSLFIRLERLVVRSATQVVFNSPSLRQVGEEAGVIEVGRGQVIGAGSGNGIDLARFDRSTLPTPKATRAALGVRTDARVIGFVGRFTRDKGIADLVDAFQSMRVDRDDVQLLLVGTFEDGDPVDAEVRHFIEGDPDVVVVPWLQHTGVAYQAMDVLAFPSSREGLPNVPLEAQLCGVPVIGYAATGTVDAIRDGVTGVLVPVGDRSAFSTELTRLIDDEVTRLRFGTTGHEWVRDTFEQRAVWASWSGALRTWLESPAGR